MPTLNDFKKTMLNKPLTNQELLTELQKRIETGTIAWEVQSRANNPWSNLFDLKVSAEKEKENTCSWFNQNTLLWVGLGVALFLLVWKRSYNLKVNLTDKTPSS